MDDDPLKTCDQCFELTPGPPVTHKYDLSGYWCSDGCATRAWVDMAAQRGVDQ